MKNRSRDTATFLPLAPTPPAPFFDGDARP